MPPRCNGKRKAQKNATKKTGEPAVSRRGEKE